MPAPQLPTSSIITDQSPYPFWALRRFIEALIAMIFGAGASTLVWRPGSVSAGNVYATWAEVVAAVAQLNGAITIGIDTDLAPAVIPPGNYDLRPAGVSGPVTLVNASKNPPFVAPFVTIAAGATTIKGLYGLKDVSIDNNSTVPVITVATNTTFRFEGRSSIFQSGAGPFATVTAGTMSWALDDFASVVANGGGPAVTVAAPGTFNLSMSGETLFDVDMLTAAVGLAVISVGFGAEYGTQAGAPAIIPAIVLQTGSAAIVAGTGKTAAIPAFVNPGSIISVSLKTPVGDALTVKYAALAADRVPGAPGSFQISALVAAGGGATNGADTSTVDWQVTNE